MWQKTSLSDRIAAITALSTLALTIVTAWLAWSTARVTRLATDEMNLERSRILYRECGPAIRSEAKNGDALVELRPDLRPPFEYNERLSRADLYTYMPSDATDYLRCQVTNAGRLPVLQMQISFAAELAHGPPFTVVTSPQALSSDPASPDSKLTVWIVGGSRMPATVYSPTLVRFADIQGHVQKPIPLQPNENDRWLLRPGKDIQEILDQRVMQPF